MTRPADARRKTIVIELADGANDNLSLNDLFARDHATRGNGRRVKMGIAAPPELFIRRKERKESA